MIKFIYFGRLVHEKGVDMIIEAFSRMHKKGITNWHVDIYGVGILSQSCKTFAEKFPHNAAFHGRAEGEHRAEIFKKQDICLMPSLIIESFGLTALESIKADIPVVGFKKGGTQPFIIDELDITQQPGNSNVDKLQHIIENICGDYETGTINYTLPDISSYSPDHRLAHFKKIAVDAKRILLVSDFIKRVGGIENYIYEVKDLLVSHGYEVSIWGTDKKNSFRGLFKTALNISGRRKLRKKIKTFCPDVIWCHSVIRELGRLPLTAIPKNNSKFKIQNLKLPKVLMMFHDMGYFHPYSSRLESLENVPQNNSLKEWLRVGHKRSLLSKTLLTMKWLALNAVKRVFYRRSTTYLVPSSFMTPYVEKSRLRDGQKVTVLPHFVK